MASIGIINADAPTTIGPAENNNRPKKIYFGVFFDGTGNNMIQRNDAKAFRKEQNWKSNWEAEVNTNLNKYGANSLKDTQLNEDGDYSNVAILHSVYQAMSGTQLSQAKQTHDVIRYNIYIEGPGKRPINNNSDLQDTLWATGYGFGKGNTGVASLVAKAANMVKLRIKAFDLSKSELHFDVFGFSRGATCARLFSYLVVRNDGDSLGCEDELSDDSFFHFLDKLTIQSKTVDFLGLFDTVSSIGVTLDDYDTNVNDYGLYSPSLQNVLHTFHLCALDEFRERFTVTDIGEAVNDKNNAEIFIPGCHTDVGGGYGSGYEKFYLKYPSKMYISNPHSSAGTTESLDGKGDVLVKLGWHHEGYMHNSLEDHSILGKIECNRYVRQGYGNIPLKMMAIRASQETKLEKFAIDAISQARFNIGEGLKEIGEMMVNYAKSASGRKFVYDKQNNYLYKNLRSFYLHFSATEEFFNKDELTKMEYVHGPHRQGDTICRMVYRGNKGDTKKYHLNDYE